ncbi:VOC family protein [Aerococcus viridans]
MRQIAIQLCFNNQAEEAVKYYTEVFSQSEITREIHYPMAKGEAVAYDFTIENQAFAAFNGDSDFKMNPSFSLMISLDTAEEVDTLYAKLAKGGKDLMPLDAYPFSDRYAWVEDQFGLSWQIMLAPDVPKNYKIRVSLLFAGQYCGQAEQALKDYAAIFQMAAPGHINYYQEGEAQDARAKVNYAELNVGDQQLVFMDHGFGSDEEFSEAISFQIIAGAQSEVDYYWEKLSADEKAERMGWLKDSHGISWQVVPQAYLQIMETANEEQKKRVLDALFKMKKMDVARLENAKFGIG